jgi:hypothetical protein
MTIRERNLPTFVVSVVVVNVATIFMSLKRKDTILVKSAIKSKVVKELVRALSTSLIVAPRIC